ncbi:MAG: 2-succinyl-5-enolpyruvyl-6-hydroxy-3-cyclohexene-1-carboxylic-acid synthase [Rhabdochlamydiaceae bacterium]
MDTGAQNETWAYKLIDALIAQGVDYFCCAPGSRSTPLALSVANHPKAKHIVHFDERGLCFHALGYGKATGKPAAVIATSGTAIGNLLPGVMEACNDRIPLILLSADRPPELRDCGANQTCDQVKLFNNFVRWQVDLPCPDHRISDRYLASTINHAVAVALYPLAGPVHINCMFREPFFSDTIERSVIERQVCFEPPVLHPSEETVRYWEKILSVKRRGVIVVGSCPIDLSEAAFSLAQRLQWPIFADILSSLRSVEGPPSLITHFDPILKLKNSIEVDGVIQFGDRFVSKTLSQWLEKQTLEFFLHLSDHPLRQDPSHLITHRVQASPLIFTRELLFSLPAPNTDNWLSEWHRWDISCTQSLAGFFSSQTSLTEPGVIWEIASFLSDDWCLFVGTSMPVRDANQFFLPAAPCGTIFGNRGVSGMDGIIATVCGIAQGKSQPTIAVIGDLTFLHDLNSLALLSKSKFPIVLCVVNNGGGGIFSFLPISKRGEAFEEFIAASHEITFESAASLFAISYSHPKTPSELSDLLLSQKKEPHSCIIEITTDRVENVQIHEQIIASIATCLNSTHSPMGIPATLH